MGAATTTDPIAASTDRSVDFWRVLPVLCLLALALLSLALLIVPLEALLTHVPINYNEGWNAFHAQRLMAGGPLYPPVSDAVFINYPPLSFYVVGALGRFVGDYVFAGRILALASLGVVALNLGLVAATLGASRLLAAIAALVFLLFVQVYFADYVAMDDPQWFGHALQTAGLLVFLRRRDRAQFRSLVVVAALLLAGGLVKQNLVALPLAITLAIALLERRKLIAWLALCGGSLGVGALLAYACYGPDFFAQVFGSARNFAPGTLIWAASHLAPRMAPFLAFGIAGVAVSWSDERTRALGLYLVVSSIAGIALMSAVGVIYSALFDCMFAAVAASAVFCRWAGERLARSELLAPSGSALATLVFALPVLTVAPHAFAYYGRLADSLGQLPAWQASIDRIAAAKGPVACESLALCYWAGRPSAIDLFNFGQYVVRHPAAGEAFAASVAAGKLALIEEEFETGSFRLPDALNAAIAARYRVDQVTPTTLLTPMP